MKNMIFLLMAMVLIFPSSGFGDRNISLPHTENFEGTWTDIAWSGSGNGSQVTKVQQSWRGGNSYCARIDPPTCSDCINGGYAALGQFNFPATNVLNVAFALNIGTTYSSSAEDVGGSLINKFIDLFNSGVRTGILGLNDRGACNGHEFGLLNANNESYNYYSQTQCVEQVYFQNGVDGANDFAGEWIFINYVVNHNTRVVTLRVWDRNGNYSGAHHQISNATVSSTSQIKTIGGYYNESHPLADANSRLLIDDLTISDSEDIIAPPNGFTGGDVDGGGGCNQWVTVGEKDGCKGWVTPVSAVSRDDTQNGRKPLWDKSLRPFSANRGKPLRVSLAPPRGVEPLFSD